MASLWKIFLVFAKVGAFTIGGGYAMIPVISKELTGRGWLSEDELPDMIALAQSAPGVLAINMAVFAGYRLRGVKGSLAAALGSALPSFLIILMIASLFAEFRDVPAVERMFKGMRPVVVALIAVPMIRMAKSTNGTWWAWAISAATMLAVAFLKISPVWIMLVLIVIGVTVTSYSEKKRDG